ncbi:polysaccharide deacetylase family protein [Kitasatospora sp. NPDC054939]
MLGLSALLSGCAAGPAPAPAPSALPAATAATPGAGTPNAATPAAATSAARTAEAADRDAPRPPAVPLTLPGLARLEEESSSEAVARRQAAARTARAAAQKWGLAQVPLTAPARPAVRAPLERAPEGTQGVKRTPGLPPVVYRVPTDEKVVFLTVDDGAEKDPEFIRMVHELGIPISSFVADYLARADYGYFRDLAANGDAVNNHSVNHRNLKLLGYEQQREEICGQQDRIERAVGVRPRLFRPPYGEYNEDTLRAAASCGIEAVPLWNEEAFPDRLDYRQLDRRLHPGDIVLTHFRGPDLWNGTMTDLLRRVLDEVTAQGFALARLDDYL